MQFQRKKRTEKRSYQSEETVKEIGIDTEFLENRVGIKDHIKEEEGIPTVVTTVRNMNDEKIAIYETM